MSLFACPQCQRPLKVKEELTGRKVKCPHCGQAVTVPEADDTQGFADSVSGAAGKAPRGELTDFLAPPQAPDELGRLGGYRVLAVLGAGLRQGPGGA